MRKVGLNYWVLGGFEAQINAQQAIDHSVEMGADCLELTFGDVLPQDITQAECEKILAYAKDKGIELLTLSSGNYWNCSLAAVDKAEVNRAIEFTKKYIKVASYLQVEMILVVPGSVDVAWDPSRPIIEYQKVWETSTASLKEILPLAEEYNVKIGLENVWNKFLLSPMEFKFYLEQFNSKNIGIYFDAGNVLINGYPDHWINILSDFILGVQVKNFSRQDSGGMLSGFGDDLLKGDLDFNRMISSLDDIGYTGCIIAEMIPFCRLPDLRLPDLKLATDTVKKLKKIFY